MDPTEQAMMEADGLADDAVEIWADQNAILIVGVMPDGTSYLIEGIRSDAI